MAETTSGSSNVDITITGDTTADAGELEEARNQTLEFPVYRMAPPAELVFRDEGDGPASIEGKVVPYNEWTEVDSLMEGHFLERFAPGSFTKTLAEQANRVRVYYEHGRSRIFDSQPIAELTEAREAEDGVFFRANLLEGLPELITAGLRRGLYGASVGAKIIKRDKSRPRQPSDYNPGRLEERTYREVKAFDFSITPRPQYAGTSVAMRSINDDLLFEQLLQDPTRLRDLIVARAEIQEEPPHSVPEEPETEPAPQGSRGTHPVRDYLRDERTPRWRLT